MDENPWGEALPPPADTAEVSENLPAASGVKGQPESPIDKSPLLPGQEPGPTKLDDKLEETANDDNPDTSLDKKNWLDEPMHTLDGLV